MKIWLEYAKSLHRTLPIANYSLYKKRREFFKKNDSRNFYDIPIFIISFNRLSYLERLIVKLESMGYTNIKIIDNASTYPPLLEFYDKTQYEVFRLKENMGHMVFWKNDLFNVYRKDLYVVTDPDILPIDDCPKDILKEFYLYLKRFPRIRKAGFSLKIDDIPENSKLYREVMKWEKPYNLFHIPFCKACAADVDTTFALYLPDFLDVSRHFITAVRTNYPYQSLHIPWYVTEDIEPTKEDLFYATRRINGFWDTVQGSKTDEAASDSWIN
ncbi:glycosyltransferase family 2 protein [Clostridium sp. MCC353]|uniref:hypothetical protein n=1 Tax=Clostridium sp. MCC353 TaxID=2592646 RepID=UPI001C02E345|nr:hypothetical protein [Clostridium sp. MCC353]MBT9776252.1 glycosyltransferase family 2 protein [Clostridium sp. MCC353]